MASIWQPTGLTTTGGNVVHAFDGFNYLIRLDKGERLSEAFQQFAAETNIEGAWVNGVGAALEVTLGFYDLDTKNSQYARQLCLKRRRQAYVSSARRL
jgi:hypothetical protein